MSSDKILIEADSRFIEKFFGLADMPAPQEVKLENLNQVVDRVREKLANMAISGAGSKPASTGSASGDSENRPKTVLIVDDLGIITYQLDMLFRKMGFEVVISQEINDAIEKYKKQDFGYAIIDLFIPTEREGFILLDELKKLSLLCKLNTKIIVMTASSKSEYQTKCLNRGANSYLEKSPGWQKKIMEICLQD